MKAKQSKIKESRADSTRREAQPQTIEIDKEVDAFIRAVAAHYGKNFQGVLNIVLKAGMREVIGQMVCADELAELSGKRKINLEPHELYQRSSQLIFP